LRFTDNFEFFYSPLIHERIEAAECIHDASSCVAFTGAFTKHKNRIMMTQTHSTESRVEPRSRFDHHHPVRILSRMSPLREMKICDMCNIISERCFFRGGWKNGELYQWNISA